ncbi:MAG: type II toxin-antitoxin system HicB family antitoxin [Gemmatimonadetes bacterium]|nr:type II toxin-antitoxin system HicB family antitoxin [Gemmatimonadota bacterium]
MIEYKGYTGVLEYDPSIEALTGHVIDIKGEIYFEGRSVDEAKASMRQAIDHYLAACEKRGIEPDRPYSGKIMLRTDPAVHRAVAIAAARERRSMNEWAEEKLAEAAGAARRKKEQAGA